MDVLIVQSAEELKNRIPDFEELANRGCFRRVHSVQEAISAIHFLVPEIVIVDVDIENGQGFRVFEDTKDVTYEKIVLTSSKGSRVRSLRFDIALQLRKPLNSNELHLALFSSIFKQQKHGIQRMFREKFDSHRQVRLSEIFLPTPEGVTLVPVKEISLVETVGNQRILTMRNGNRLATSASSRRICNLLRGNDFVLTHGSILLNTREILRFGKFDGKSVAIMRSGRRLPVSYLDECKIRARWHCANHGIT